MIQSVFLGLAMAPCLVLLLSVVIYYRDLFREENKKARIRNIGKIRFRLTSFQGQVAGKQKEKSVNKGNNITYVSSV